MFIAGLGLPGTRPLAIVDIARGKAEAGISGLISAYRRVPAMKVLAVGGKSGELGKTIPISSHIT